jgi:hypothetical protein
MGIPAANVDVSVSDKTALDGSSLFYLTTKVIDNPITSLLTLIKKLDESNVQVADIDVKQLLMTSGGVTAPVFQYKTVESKQKLVENNMWWLVFLVLLLPVISILVRQAYRKGKKRERRRNAETVRTQAMPMQGMKPYNNNNNQGGQGWQNQGGYESDVSMGNTGNYNTGDNSNNNNNQGYYNQGGSGGQGGQGYYSNVNTVVATPRTNDDMQ